MSIGNVYIISMVHLSGDYMNTTIKLFLILSTWSSFVFAENLVIDSTFTLGKKQKNSDINVLKKMDISKKYKTYYGPKANVDFTINFKSVKKFNAVQLIASDLKNSLVEVSIDGNAWTSIDALVESQSERWTCYYAEPIDAKFIRFQFDSAAIDKSKAAELKSLSISHVTDTHNKALFKEISVRSKDLNYRYPVSYLNDGNVDSHIVAWKKWKDAEFIINLGEEQQISKVLLLEKGVLNKVLVSISINNSDWTEVGSSDQASDEHLIEFKESKAKYIKVSVAGLFNHKLSEILVF